MADSPQYWYMRVVHSFGGQLCTIDPNPGLVSTDPVAAFKRYQLAFERQWQAAYPQLAQPERAGCMFAVWRLPSKMPPAQAMSLARGEVPYRVYVCPGEQWGDLVPFTLPEGVLIVV